MSPHRLAFALALALALAAPAAAQESWSLQVTPYAWGSGVSGDFTPFSGGPTVDFDASLGDVLEDLDGAFFLTAVARRGDFVVMGDLSWASSSREGVVPPGLPAEGELTQRSVTLLAGWRVQAEPATLDLLAGVRHWDVELSAAAPAVGLSARRDASFTDPIIAARTVIPLTERLSVMAYADVGGFGTGSEATNQQVVTINYTLNDRVVLSGGWRRLFVDYDGKDEGTGFEATLTGPLVGATFRF